VCNCAGLCHVRAGGEPQSSDSEATTTKNGKHDMQI